MYVERATQTAGWTPTVEVWLRWALAGRAVCHGCVAVCRPGRPPCPPSTAISIRRRRSEPPRIAIGMMMTPDSIRDYTETANCIYVHLSRRTYILYILLFTNIPQLMWNFKWACANNDHCSMATLCTALRPSIPTIKSWTLVGSNHGSGQVGSECVAVVQCANGRQLQMLSSSSSFICSWTSHETRE